MLGARRAVRSDGRLLDQRLQLRLDREADLGADDAPHDGVAVPLEVLLHLVQRQQLRGGRLGGGSAPGGGVLGWGWGDGRGPEVPERVSEPLHPPGRDVFSPCEFPAEYL